MNNDQLKNAIRALGFTLMPAPEFTIAAVSAEHPWRVDPKLQALAAQFGLTWNLETRDGARWVLEA